MIRVVLNVASPALRAGLRALLSSDRTIKVVNDELSENIEAEVVVMSASVLALEGTASAGILFLGDEQLDIEELKRAHRVWGVLPAESSAEELIAALHALSQGLIVGTPALLFESSEPAGRGPLTERETEVLNYLAEGMANKQIAAALGISEHTVKFHVSSIYTKLNVLNRAEAVREGLRGGWIAL